MKKENRKMAQQRRAQERKKNAIRKRISTILAVLIPILVLAALMAILIIFSAPSSSDSSGGSDTGTAEDSSGSGSTDTTDTTDSDSANSSTDTYSTDTSLTVEDGDTVNIDYVGSIDGVEFDGGNTNGAGTDLTIGSGLYIDDFEEQLIGAHPGDTVEVNVTFPEDYGNEELNGKDAVFEVVINGIYE